VAGVKKALCKKIANLSLLKKLTSKPFLKKRIQSAAIINHENQYIIMIRLENYAAVGWGERACLKLPNIANCCWQQSFLLNTQHWFRYYKKSLSL